MKVNQIFPKSKKLLLKKFHFFPFFFNNLLKSKEQESAPIIIQEPGTPRALPGREHVSVETDEFVETLTDKPPFYEKEAQTEFNIEKPALRHYLPVKTGISKETQIWDGDLFDFDYEVEPILQVLLGKTLEHSRMEVLEEEELRVMKQQQEHYAKLKREEFEEIHRLEEKERKLLEEIVKKCFHLFYFFGKCLFCFFSVDFIL